MFPLFLCKKFKNNNSKKKPMGAIDFLYIKENIRMLKSKKIKIKVANKNYSLYKEKYDNCVIGEEIEVNVKDIPLNSRILVEVICDNCNIDKNIKYCDYIKVYNKKNKYFCSKCRNVSIKEGVQKKYGVDNVFQLQEIKGKTEKTNLEKYGVKHHLQNKHILEKQKKTNQERYGVNFIPELRRYTQEDFIKKCNDIHNSRYEYPNMKYETVENYIDIKCKKHGIFSQVGREHLKGQGCPKCATSKGEEFIINYLNDNGISYNFQKTFDGCVYKNKLPFDFYISSMNMLLEYDGEQHFKVIENWGGEEEFKLRQIKDKIKNKYCMEKQIRLERIKYDEDLENRLDKIFKK